MAAITASMVAELRAKTDAPMMECKKALTEADGDMAKAEELLRVKLGTKAGKAASRVTAEGVIAAHVAGDTGAMIEVNCETDFVTKNDMFLNMAAAAAKLVAEQNPADVAALGALAYSQDGFGPTLEDVRVGLIGKIGENMSFRRFVRKAGKVASYVHGTRIGVLVEYTGDEAAAKDVAMHVAAMKPVALASSEVPAELIEKERSVATAKGGRIRQAGRHRHQDDRRCGAEIPEGSLAVQPAFREERQAIGRADAEGERHHGDRLHPVRGGRGHREEAGRLRRRSGRASRCCARQVLTVADGAHALSARGRHGPRRTSHHA